MKSFSVDTFTFSQFPITTFTSSLVVFSENCLQQLNVSCVNARILHILTALIIDSFSTMETQGLRRKRIWRIDSKVNKKDFSGKKLLGGVVPTIIRNM